MSETREARLQRMKAWIHWKTFEQGRSKENAEFVDDVAALVADVEELEGIADGNADSCEALSREVDRQSAYVDELEKSVEQYETQDVHEAMECHQENVKLRAQVEALQVERDGRVNDWHNTFAANVQLAEKLARAEKLLDKLNSLTTHTPILPDGARLALREYAARIGGEK